MKELQNGRYNAQTRRGDHKLHGNRKLNLEIRDQNLTLEVHKLETGMGNGTNESAGKCITCWGIYSQQLKYLVDIPPVLTGKVLA